MFILNFKKSETLLWIENDSFLLSESESGVIYVWDCLTWEKTFEHYYTNSKKIKTLALEYDGELDLLVYSTSDSHLKMFYRKGNISIINYWLEEFTVTALTLVKRQKVLLGGTDRGSIGIFHSDQLIDSLKHFYFLY